MRLAPRVREALSAAAAYAAITTWLFRPLVRHLGSVSVTIGDALGNMWALTWAGRHLLEPRVLYDAPIFYPTRGALILNEGLFAQALEAGPLLALGASPLVAYNVVFLLTFPLSALAAYALARDLSASRGGAFIAGLGYAFCAYRFHHLPHVHTLSYQWFPLVLLALRRTLGTGSARWAVALGAFGVLQAWSSGYYAALLAPVCALALLAGWRSAPAPGRRAAVLALATAGLIAATPLLTYWWQARVQGFTRSREECVHWSAWWRSYLEPGELATAPHLRALHDRFASPAALFPGTAVAVLAAVALVRRRRDRGVLGLALLAAAGLLLSLGPDIHVGSTVVTGPFELLRYLPGFGLLRTPSRMGVITVLALDILAAFGYAELARAGARARVVRAGILALAVWESATFDAASRLGVVPPPPPVADWLRTAPRGPVLELPWEDPADSPPYLYWSNVHAQPMVNGWASFEPQRPMELARIASCCWPRDYAVRTLRGAGVRYVVVHLDRLRAGMRARIEGAGELPVGVVLEAAIGADRVYSIAAAPVATSAR